MQAEEAPFLTGMEREPETPAKSVFREDGFTYRVAVEARDLARAAMDGLRSAMESRERGPDPDARLDEDDDIRRLASIIERLAQRPPSNDYNEAPKPEGNLKAVVIGCTVTIVSAGIIGVIVLSNNFSALRAEFTEWKTATEYRLQQLERRP